MCYGKGVKILISVINMQGKDQKIVLISSYRPRDCGIATFSYDLVNAIESFSKMAVEIIPINESAHENRIYDQKVNITISSEDENSYVLAADYINKSSAVALCLQHEFGLFGGDQGEYIIKLIDLVKKPVITTFHTVLSKPSKKQKQVLGEIATKSDAIVVMADTAVDILVDKYGIPETKIAMIPHGVPELPFENQLKAKKKIGLEGNLVISTFGLLGPGKGLKYVIDALPEVISKYPKVKYLILGRTHPEIAKKAGEGYRENLIAKINELGLTDHVRLDNRFLSDDEIALNLMATDIYITPYQNPQQITSGTLARALSIGRTCISTPYTYAKEILDDNRGILVPFGNSQSISGAIISLFSNDKKRNEIERLNYIYSRPMIWKSVARNYIDLLQNLTVKKSDASIKSADRLTHLKKMTTKIGIIQHSKSGIPDLSFGYSIDDSARALIAVYQYFETHKDDSVLSLSTIYLNYIKRAKIKNGYFHNFSDKNGTFTDDIGSETSSARAIWALGYIVNRSRISKSNARLAREILNDLSPIEGLEHLRSKAYALVGYYYLGDVAKVKYLADNLLNEYEKNKEDHWFEGTLTYGNAMMPFSLYLAYSLLNDEKYLKVANESLSFLDNVMRVKGTPSPIGHVGWDFDRSDKPIFDQQVIEVTDMILAATVARNLTGKKKFDKITQEWLSWFYGNNINNENLIDPTTGGCFDALTPTGKNINQGAESIVCYLLADLAATNPLLSIARMEP